MRIGKKFVIVLVCLLILSFMAIFRTQISQVGAQGSADLTGNIYDSGVDTDGDGTFDYLEVIVEVDVYSPGWFWVYVSGLLDVYYRYISVMDSQSIYLDVGIRNVSLSLDGETIYASGLNPAYVQHISIEDGYYDSRSVVPLLREYSYTEFDSPPAFLTDNIYDRGVDTDGDDFFDYLEVGVEVNVTEPGDYTVDVSGLRGRDWWDSIDVWDSETAYLDVGAHVINVSLHGPTIHYSGVNPAYVSSIYLYDEYHNYLGRLSNVPLSRECCHIEFDAPFADMEVKLIVYPDGKVEISGALDFSPVAPKYTGPAINGTTSITTSDNTTSASADYTIIIPTEEASKFPFNATEATLIGTYSEDLLNVEINCSVILPETLDTTPIASEFPFNATDFTVVGEYAENMLDGTITVHLLPGFALGDINIDFEGDRTSFSLSGTATVIYGTYYYDTMRIEVNETILEGILQQLNNLTGIGSASLYNMTGGWLECTRVYTKMTPIIAPPGAAVDFEMDTEGDLIGALAYVMSGGMPDNETIFSLLDATLPSFENASFQLAYAYAQKQVSMKLTFVANLTSLIDNVRAVLPEIAPEYVTPVDLLLNTTFCSVESAEFSLLYKEGRADIKADVTIEGDFNAELNYAKGIVLNYSMPEGEPLPWQAWFFNETEIDISNFKISLNMTEASVVSNMEGLVLLPPREMINATCFTLDRFFYLAKEIDDMVESTPNEMYRIKVIIEGGSNGTHAVTLWRPETLQEPDETDPDKRRMVWYNQHITDLRGLTFNIVELPAPAPVWAQLWFWAAIGGVIVVASVVAVAYALTRKKPPTPTPPKPTKKRESRTKKAVP